MSAHSELERLVWDAWELKERKSPYFLDAVAAIEAWWDGKTPTERKAITERWKREARS